MMRIIILTSSRCSTASFCLPLLKGNKEIDVVKVIYSRGEIKKDWRYYKKRVKKVWKIGLLGAINGVRLRNWFEGAGLKNDFMDIEALCKKLEIPYVETPFIGHEDTIGLIRDANVDLGISLSNPYIPKKIFSIPKHGMINIHGEVLPAFQNAQSIIWQIYEGSRETGYTIHKIDRHIDTGEILKQERFPIPFRETFEWTVREGVDEILRRAGKGLVEVVVGFSEFVENAKPQGKGNSYTTPSIRQFKQMRNQFELLKKSEQQ